MEPNSGVIPTPLHFLKLLNKFLKLRSSHVLPVFFNQFELNWCLGADKWEWKHAFKCGVGKSVDGSSKRIDGVGMLIGRAANLCNYLPNELPSLPRFDSEFQQGNFLTISFRRNRRLRYVYFIPCNAVSWLSICYIEDVSPFLFLPAVWFDRLPLILLAGI